jgi:hypothetical protein
VRGVEGLRVNPSWKNLRARRSQTDRSSHRFSRERRRATADENGMITRNRSKHRRTKARRGGVRRSSEKRASERSSLFAAAVLYTEVSPVTHKVWVTNISLGGLSFRTRREYEAGQTFHIRLQAGPIDMDHPIKVVWSRQNSDGFYDVGVEFIPD